MPDLITHMALSHLIRRPFDVKKADRPAAPFRYMFYFGAILPDILTRPWYIIFPATHDWTVVFHTPFGMILTCALVSLLFESTLRKRIFINLFAGSFGHFLLDALQKKFTGNDYWFFPVSWKSVGYGLAYADQFMDLIPLWIGLVAVLEGCIYLSTLFKNRNNCLLQ